MVEIDTQHDGLVTINPASVTGWHYEDSAFYGDPFYRVYTAGKEFQVTPVSFEALRPYLPAPVIGDAKMAAAQLAWDALKSHLRGIPGADTQRLAWAMSQAMDALK